jgi:hypothetical protein
LRPFEITSANEPQAAGGTHRHQDLIENLKRCLNKPATKQSEAAQGPVLALALMLSRQRDIMQATF